MCCVQLESALVPFLSKMQWSQRHSGKGPFCPSRLPPGHSKWSDLFVDPVLH